jgi:cytolysin-activating lysine-acyltransferase
MTNKTTDAIAALEQAKGALAKLPILGPAMWLYARDSAKKFMFVGDIDWAILPPIVLDQCRLYTRGGLPYAFVTWALVSETIATRLRSEQPKIAPHEWQSGEEVWLIDAVAPFGQLEETINELRGTTFAGRKVSALLPDASRAGAVVLREWPAVQAAKLH